MVTVTAKLKWLKCVWPELNICVPETYGDGTCQDIYKWADYICFEPIQATIGDSPTVHQLTEIKSIWNILRATGVTNWTAMSALYTNYTNIYDTKAGTIWTDLSALYRHTYDTTCHYKDKWIDILMILPVTTGTSWIEVNALYTT